MANQSKLIAPIQDGHLKELFIEYIAAAYNKFNACASICGQLRTKLGKTQEQKTFSLGDRFQPFPLVSMDVVSDGYDVNATATKFSVVFFQAARKGQSLLYVYFRLSTFLKSIL